MRFVIPSLIYLSLCCSVTTADDLKDWKFDVEVISSSKYVVNNMQSYCDKSDAIWVKVLVNFAENTDAYHARSSEVVLRSLDGGVTWEWVKHAWPGLLNDRSVLPNGHIVETGTHYWLRHPRARIESLRQRGFYVWDLGKNADYCAILYDMWVRRSQDGGRTWKAFAVHDQFGFFSRLAVNSPPHQRLLKDGTIVQFAHGYRPKDRTPKSDLGGRNHPFILRSSDEGRHWRMVQMADGYKSPSPRGFNEIYPVVWQDGRIFALLRTQAGGTAYSVYSADGGQTWSQPRFTPIQAKHPNPTELSDGSIVCSYQRRFAKPFGIRARFTRDVGKTWSEEIILRDDIPFADGLVQPQTVELSDGSLFTIFTGYRRNKTGGKQSFIGGTRWTREQTKLSQVDEIRKRLASREAYSPKLPLPPLKPRYNDGKADQSPWQLQ